MKSRLILAAVIHPRLETDYKGLALDAATATAATPTFLKPHLTSDAIELVDGGVWANNPIGVAAIEAVGMLRRPADRPRPKAAPANMTNFGVHES